MSVTIIACAIDAGAKKEENGSVNGAEIERVGFNFMGGCARCEASLHAGNAYPSMSGYWLCSGCIDDTGFETVQAFNDWNAPQEEGI